MTPSSAQISIDEDSLYYIIDVATEDPQTIANATLGSPIELQIGAETYKFVVTGATYSRKYEAESGRIQGRSLLSELERTPWNKGDSRDAMEVCCTLIPGLQWEIDSWLLPHGYGDFIDGEMVVEVVGRIVSAVGALLESTCDGFGRVRYRYREHVPNWNLVAVDLYLEDSDIISIEQRASYKQLFNEVVLFTTLPKPDDSGDGGSGSGSGGGGYSLTAEKEGWGRGRILGPYGNWWLRSTNGGVSINGPTQPQETGVERVTFSGGTYTPKEAAVALLSYTWVGNVLGSLYLRNGEIACSASGFGIADIEYAYRKNIWDISGCMIDTYFILEDVKGNAVASVVANFANEGGIFVEDAHLSIEVRPEFNGAKTVFKKGDTVYVTIYQTSNVSITSMVATTGVVYGMAPSTILMKEVLLFNGGNRAKLGKPARNLVSPLGVVSLLGEMTVALEEEREQVTVEYYANAFITQFVAPETIDVAEITISITGERV